MLHRISLTHPDECHVYMNTAYYALQCVDKGIVTRLVTFQLHRSDGWDTQKTFDYLIQSAQLPLNTCSSNPDDVMSAFLIKHTRST
jgi:hypothetical protein